MSKSINLSFYSLLAESSYADFSQISDKNKSEDILSKKFNSDNFAELVFQNFEVIAHRKDYADNFGTASALHPDSGFSATLFKGKEDTSNAGEYVLALKGSAGTKDLIVADGKHIVANGLAYHQIADMYNFWQQIKAEKDGTYQAAVVREVSDIAADVLTDLIKMSPDGRSEYLSGLNMLDKQYFIDITEGSLKYIDFLKSVLVYSDERAKGLGLDVQSVTVTGHSLGGHLAAAFSRLFPEATEAAYMVNGAGFNTAQAGNIRSVFAALSGASSFDGSKIINIIGDKNMDLVAQDWWVGLQQPGQAVELFIEQPSLFSSTLGHGSDCNQGLLT